MRLPCDSPGVELTNAQGIRKNAVFVPFVSGDD
jgi:hypothetical protein